MNLKKQYVINIPYMHPICPMSLSHARIFLVADIIGRYKEKEGFEVYLPIGAHYSGKQVIDIFNDLQIYIKKAETEKIKKYSTPWLFLDYYKMSSADLKKFYNPQSILEFFSNQQINNLKKLKTKFNFNRFYNTKNPKYDSFVKQLFKKYEHKNLIIKTKEGRAINFNKEGWKDLAVKQLNKIKIIRRGGEKILENSILNLGENWNFEREVGVGTKINGKIINPMFDSQLYNLFESERFNYKLPVNVFIAETHLSTWLASKILMETAMLNKNQITKSYFLLGLAFTKDRKKMSSSRGTSILLPDLLEKHGAEVTRISIILAGHPNKDFFWDNKILEDTKNIIRRFRKFEIESSSFEKKSNNKINEIIRINKMLIKNNLERGDLRKACIMGLIVFPEEIKKLKLNNGDSQIKEHLEYITYIFLPKK